MWMAYSMFNFYFRMHYADVLLHIPGIFVLFVVFFSFFSRSKHEDSLHFRRWYVASIIYKPDTLNERF